MATETIHDVLPHLHYVRHTYVAQCSCGWLSEEVLTEKAADRELRNHHISKENAR